MKINVVTDNDSIFLNIVYTDGKLKLADEPKLLLKLMDDEVISLDGQLLEETISLKNICPSVKEIADLCYDPIKDWLWMVDSEAHKIFIFTADAHQCLGKIELPTFRNEESICVDHAHGCIWVGDDDDSQPAIYRYELTWPDE